MTDVFVGMTDVFVGMTDVFVGMTDVFVGMTDVFVGGFNGGETLVTTSAEWWQAHDNGADASTVASLCDVGDVHRLVGSCKMWFESARGSSVRAGRSFVSRTVGRASVGGGEDDESDGEDGFELPTNVLRKNELAPSIKLCINDELRAQTNG